MTKPRSWHLLGLTCLALLAGATAQTGTQTPPPAPTETLPGPGPFTAESSAARTQATKDGVTIQVIVRNTTSGAQTLSFSRNSQQNCAFAPHVRVLRVGTREVVYPNPAAEGSICTQELRSESVPGNGEHRLTRTLPLPAGEYMIEVWVRGFGGDDVGPVFIKAQPVRVTVK